jgi:shikimate dehydrogenase
MKSINFLEFNPRGPGLFLRQFESLSKEQGWDIQFEYYSEFNTDLLKDADIVKIDMSLSAIVLRELKLQPTLVRNLQSTDFLIKEEGHWYPRVFLYEALKKVLVEYARGLDNRESAFVVGTAEEAMVSGAVLAHLGFRKIYFTGHDMAELKLKTELLKKNFFGIEFSTLDSGYLTAQTIGANIVVNTINIAEDKELLKDMSYFNYMKRRGFVVDLNLVPYHNPLLEEAQRAELRVVYPIPIAAEETYYCLKHLDLLGQLKVEDLCQSWERFLMENFEASAGMR